MVTMVLVASATEMNVDLVVVAVVVIDDVRFSVQTIHAIVG
jgi:hypothetical protein